MASGEFGTKPPSDHAAQPSSQYQAPPPPSDIEAPPSPPPWLSATWQSTLVVGVLTLILGIIVSFHPTASLNVIAVLFGVLLILSGIFQLIRVFDPLELNRFWAGISGLLFIVIGVVLIRHLHLTRALIGLFIGITWIVQGLGAVIGGAAGVASVNARSGRRSGNAGRHLGGPGPHSLWDSLWVVALDPHITPTG